MCTHNICLYDQILIVCTILRRSLLSLFLYSVLDSLLHSLRVYCLFLLYFTPSGYFPSSTTASLTGYPGLFWVSYPILTLLRSRWSRLFPWFPIPPVFFFSQSFGDRSKRIKCNWPVTHMFLNFLCSQAISKYLSIFFPFSPWDPLKRQNPLDDKFIFLVN